MSAPIIGFVCSRCQGSGVDPVPEAVCCGRPTPGDAPWDVPECCGQPDLVQQPCASCGGEGVVR